MKYYNGSLYAFGYIDGTHLFYYVTDQRGVCLATAGGQYITAATGADVDTLVTNFIGACNANGFPVDNNSAEITELQQGDNVPEWDSYTNVTGG